MFSGDTRGTLLVNEQKLHEIRSNISTRRLANQIRGKNHPFNILIDQITNMSEWFKRRRQSTTETEYATINPLPNEI